MARPEDKMNFRCERCGKTIKGVNFYNTKNLEKYPQGKLYICKNCATRHIDCWDPETFLWLLEEIDVPYVPEEWNKTIAGEIANKKEITGILITGKYLSKMHLNQYKKYHYSDTEALRAISDKRVREAMERQGYSQGEIALQLEKGAFDVPEKPPQQLSPGEKEVQQLTQYRSAPERPQANYVAPAPIAPMVNGKAIGEPELVRQEPEPDDQVDLQLSDEEKLYLRLKWGKEYRPEEWVALEKLYAEMMESYDIQSAGHVDNLKLLCKTSLKCNQLIDINDVEGYQKMSKVYDQLMKSGKFTAAQSKELNEGAVDSIGELVAMCERDGFIPRYYIDKPADKVDQVIFDLQQYTKNLITEELGMGNLLENALRKLQEEQEIMKKEATEGETVDVDENVDNLMSYEDIPTDRINVEDYNEFQELEEQWAQSDHQLYAEGGDS